MTKNCCCCSPVEEKVVTLKFPESDKDRAKFITTGLGLTTPFGIRASFAKVYSPFSVETENRRRRETGVKRVLHWPDDPSFLPDSRRDCSALTPIYRGGQNSLLRLSDLFSDHGPAASLAWIGGSSWSTWDGVTTVSPFFPNTYTAGQVATARALVVAHLFPNGNSDLRGIKALYDASPPFEDPLHPKVSEIEIWNTRVINHCRALLGVSQPLSTSQNLFLTSNFANERRYKPSIWSSYTGTLDSTYGPCNSLSPIHCGEFFVPSFDDQIPYWNDHYCANTSSPTKSGVSSGGIDAGAFTPTTDPQMLFTARWLRDSFNSADGHLYPMVLRPQYGFNSYWVGTDRIIKYHWSGTLFTIPSGNTFFGLP